MRAELFFLSPQFFSLDFPGKAFNEITSYAFYEIYFNVHLKETVMNYYVDVRIDP